MKVKSIFIVVVLIAIISIAGIYILNTSNNNSQNIQNERDNTDPAQSNTSQTSAEEKLIEISLRNMSAQPQQDQIDIQLAFDAFNPGTRSTVILENIHYYVYVNNSLLVAGDIGSKPEGFVTSQQGIYPVVANGTVTLKDRKTVQAEALDTDILNEIVNKSAAYQVNGTYSYTQTSSLQAVDGENEFNFITN